MATVATQEVFARTDALSEVWDLGAATPENTLVKQAGSARFGVSLTDTKGVVKPDLTIYGNVKVTGFTQPGVGNEDAVAVSATGFAAGVATDGTWEFPGVVSTGTTPAPTSTAQGVVVYATGTGTNIALTLDSASGANARVGVVNYPATYVKAAGTLPVKIGA